MNIFNRIVMILLFIALIALAVLVIVTPLTITNALRSFANFAESYFVPPFGTYIVIGAVVLGVIALILLFLELRRSNTRLIRIQKVSGGQAYLRTESIARRLAWHVGRVGDVTAVDPRVRARGSSVNVVMNVDTRPDIQVPMKTEEILAVVRDQVETQMGLRLRSSKLHLRSIPYPRKPEYAEEASQAWTAPATTTSSAATTPPPIEDEAVAWSPKPAVNQE